MYSLFGKVNVDSETYLEPSRTSTMELFCEASERLKAVNYFRKKAPEYVFGWVLNTPLRLNIENYSDPQNESVKFQVIRGGSRPVFGYFDGFYVFLLFVN